MSKALPVPTFAVQGHPNEGKSTVVSTLTEDDSVRVSAIPGETVACQTFPVAIDGQEIIRFVDTPGFQNPQATLAWFRQHQEPGSNLAREFRDTHAAEPGFKHECELLRPIAEGAGIIYVVDGSRPVDEDDRAEMEILRLTGNPRMALINSKEDESDYVQEWREALRQCFNSTRVFNAHHATYADRIALLETVRSMDQDWEPALQRTIDVYREDWSRRLARTADSLCDYLARCATHRETKNIADDADEMARKAALQARYKESIRDFEVQLQGRIRKIFKHTRVGWDLGEQSILNEDLFSEKTWQALGLTRWQLAATAAAGGALAGAFIDAHFMGATFLLGTLIGGAVGGAGVYLTGEAMAAVRVKGFPLGGKQLVVGPNANPNFPFVLLDRALIFFSYAIRWSHGRRYLPQEETKTDTSKHGPTSTWDAERRKICGTFVKRLFKGSSLARDEARRQMSDMLQKVLREISAG